MAPKQETCKVCGAPRDPAARSKTARCTVHDREYMLEANRRYRAEHAEQKAHDKRIRSYLHYASELGADEAEAWWCAMAIEANRALNGGMKGTPMVQFIERELTWLRTNAGVLERLDAAAYAPVLGEAVIVDEGWELDEGAA